MINILCLSFSSNSSPWELYTQGIDDMFWLGSFKVPALIPARTLRYSEVSLERAVGTAADLARPKITRKAKKLV